MTEGISLLSERYLRHRYRVGFEEGFKKGFEKSFKKSFIRARDEMLDWFKRREAAAAEGKPFNEPPPGGWESFNRSRYKNNAKAQEELANVVQTAVNDALANYAISDLVQWSVRKGVAEALGQPFNEPHPFNGATRRNGNGTV